MSRCAGIRYRHWAVVEYLAHLAMLPSGLLLMTVEIPDTLKIERVHSVPADPAAFTQLEMNGSTPKPHRFLKSHPYLCPGRRTV